MTGWGFWTFNLCTGGQLMYSWNCMDTNLLDGTAAPPPTSSASCYTVSWDIVASGPLSEFEEAAFKTNLAAQLNGVSASDITLTTSERGAGTIAEVEGCTTAETNTLVQVQISGAGLCSEQNADEVLSVLFDYAFDLNSAETDLDVGLECVEAASKAVAAAAPSPPGGDGGGNNDSNNNSNDGGVDQGDANNESNNDSSNGGSSNNDDTNNENTNSDNDDDGTNNDSTNNGSDDDDTTTDGGDTDDDDSTNSGTGTALESSSGLDYVQGEGPTAAGADDLATGLVRGLALAVASVAAGLGCMALRRSREARASKETAHATVQNV